MAAKLEWYRCLLGFGDVARTGRWLWVCDGQHCFFTELGTIPMSEAMDDFQSVAEDTLDADPSLVSWLLFRDGEVKHNGIWMDE